jgi:hypothetical protein
MRDAAGRLLYVGITADPEHRWRAHGQVQTWWQQVATIDVEHFATRGAAEDAERVAIKSERPEFNRMHVVRPAPPVNTDLHTPTHSIRMGDRWDLLGEAYGDRARSALFEQVAAWLLREPGAKLPQRVEQPAAEERSAL